MSLRRLATAFAVAVCCTACVSGTAEPTAQSPGPAAEPSPTAAAEPTSQPPEVPVTTPSGPGRQPPLPNGAEVRLQTATDTIALLDGATAQESLDVVSAALTAGGWTVTSVGDAVVASRSTAQPVTSGRPFHLVTATLESPSGVGVLVAVAQAFASRSTHLPTRFVVGATAADVTAYAGSLSAAERVDLADTIPVRVPDDAAGDELRAVAVTLLRTI